LINVATDTRDHLFPDDPLLGYRRLLSETWGLTFYRLNFISCRELLLLLLPEGMTTDMIMVGVGLRPLSTLRKTS
jgi:hypothetical protein